MFWGDKKNQFLSLVCNALKEKFNVSQQCASKYIIITRFHLFLSCNFSPVICKSPEYWAEQIVEMFNQNLSFA